MKLLEIAKERARKMAVLERKVNDQCTARVQELVARLPRFDIRELRMGLVGMGDWYLQGGDLSFEHGDGTDSVEGISELNIWMEEHFGGELDTTYTPKGITAKDRHYLKELYKLCKWWAKTTGGVDVKFK